MASFNAGAIEATLELDRSPFSRGIELARAQGRRFAATRYVARLDVDAGRAAATIAALQGQLAALGVTSPTVNVNVNGAAQVAAMQAQVAALQAQLAGLNGQRTTTTVDVDTSRARLGLLNLIGIGAALAPAIIPAITGITAAVGALVSVLATAGAGLAVLGAGVIGNVASVLGAQKDMTAAQEAGKAAAQQYAAAQRGVQDAVRGLAGAQAGVAQAQAAAASQVASAERALADARRQAAQQVAAAEDALGLAHDRVRRAQEALTLARVDARERLDELRDSLTGAALDEEGAELAVRRAAQRMREVAADAGASDLDRDEARLAYEQAVYQLGQVRDERDKLQRTWREESKAGVEGSREVTAARDTLREAQEGVQQAEENLARARADGARAVADARRQLAEAETQGAQQVAAARTQVADAERRLADARRQAAEAGAAVAESNAAAAAAAAKMTGPAGAFLKVLDRVKESWREFLDLTAAASFGVVNQTLELVARYLPDLAPVAVAAAEGVTAILNAIERWAASGGVDAFVAFMVEYGPPAIESLGLLFLNLTGWLGGLVEAFAPFSQEFMAGLNGMAEGWRQWASDLDSNAGFEAFLTFVRETGPLFLDTLGSMFDALVQIGKAMAPAAEPILVALRETFDFIAGLDPTTLQVAAVAIGAIMAATGVGAIGGAAIALSALVAIIADGADKSDRFAGVLSDMGDVARDVIGWLVEKGRELWDDVLRPGFEGIGAVLRDDVIPAVSEFWRTIEPVVLWLAEVAFDMLKLGVEGLLQIVKGGLKAVAGVFRFLTGLFTGDWRKMWQGAKDIAVGLWDMIVGAAKVFLVTGLGKVVGLAFKAVAGLFRGGGRIIGGLWDDMLNGIRRIAGDAWAWVTLRTEALWDDAVRFFLNGGTRIGGLFGKAMTAVRDAAGDAVTWLLAKLGTGPGGLMNRLGDVFTKGVGIIGKAWGKIKDAFSGPVTFVIDRVINTGVIGGYNWIANKLPGVPTIEEVPVPRWATGTSRVPGVDNGRDTVRALLRPNEAVLVPQVADALGRDRIETWNKTAARGLNPDVWAGIGGGLTDFLGWVKDKALDKPAQAFRSKALGLVGDLTGGMTGMQRLPVGMATRAVGSMGDWLLEKLGAGALKPTPKPGGGGGVAGNLPRSGWHLPVTPYVVSAGFPNYASGAYHGGVDLAGPYGSRVYPINKGTVTASYDIPGSSPYNNFPYASYGRVVDVSHGGGITSRYAHLQNRHVAAGQQIDGNQSLGERGSMGNSTGPHVHLEVMRNGIKIDPQDFLRSVGVTMDGGGMLPRGGVAFNASRKPEPVLTSDQWDLIRGQALAAANGGRAGVGGGITRDDVREMIDALREAAPVYVPADEADKWGQVAFELRAQRRGGRAA